MNKNNKINYSLKKYNEFGYVVRKQLINKITIQEILENISKNLNKIKKFKTKGSLHEDLIFLRENNKVEFGLLFDTIQTNIKNYSILTDEKIINLCKKILKEKSNSINLTDVSLRLDPPHDQKNSLGWHQDSSYFRQNNKCFDSLVLWTPLIDLNSKTGGIEFLEKSFSLGSLRVSKQKNNLNKNTSKQRLISDKKLKNFKMIKCDQLNKGDAIIMNMDMAHRSGYNSSNKFRISLIGRFHKTLVNSFNSGLNIYKYSDKNLDKEVHNGR